MGLVEQSVLRSSHVIPSLCNVSVSSSPSFRLAAALGVLATPINENDGLLLLGWPSMKVSSDISQRKKMAPESS
jgi:hypothetical protein